LLVYLELFSEAEKTQAGKKNVERVGKVGEGCQSETVHAAASTTLRRRPTARIRKTCPKTEAIDYPMNEE
jgi:hypothetical protein